MTEDLENQVVRNKELYADMVKVRCGVDFPWERRGATVHACPPHPWTRGL